MRTTSGPLSTGLGSGKDNELELPCWTASGERSLDFVSTRLLALALLLPAFISLSCGNILSSGGSSSNLVPNSSFEYNGMPSLRYWTVFSAPDSITEDAPPGGGKWSLQLLPRHTPRCGVRGHCCNRSIGHRSISFNRVDEEHGQLSLDYYRAMVRRRLSPAEGGLRPRPENAVEQYFGRRHNLVVIDRHDCDHDRQFRRCSPSGEDKI